MRNRVFALLDELRGSYWFIPAVMALSALALSLVATRLDQVIGPRFAESIGGVYVDTPQGARVLLSTVASSMITVAGVVFSLTMVVLSLASQQYGSLVLENFMRDRGNQFVLGTFTAAFTYSLLVLRTIHTASEQSVYTPHVSSLFGVLLALMSVAVLIYFVHHVSESIKASTIISRVSHDLMSAVDTLFPDSLDSNAGRVETGVSLRDAPAGVEQRSRLIRAPNSGYVQFIDRDQLLQIAQDNDITIKLDHRPGQFVMAGAIRGRVWPGEQVDDNLLDQINSAFILGGRRTPTQNIEFSFTQLVQIGVRALSPGINDPFTAMMCIDRLGEALSLLGSRVIPAPYYYDENHALRVITNPIVFETLVRESFDPIRHYGRGDVTVSTHLLRTLILMGECLHSDMRKDVLTRYARLVWRDSRRQLVEAEDMAAIDRVYHEATRVLVSRDRL